MAETKKLERIYTVNLSKAYEYTRTRRANRTVKLLREFVARHMKTAQENIKMSNIVNSRIWRDSIQRPPRRLKIKAVKEDDTVVVSLYDEENIVAKKEKKTKDKIQKKESKKTIKEKKTTKVETKNKENNPKKE